LRLAYTIVFVVVALLLSSCEAFVDSYRDFSDFSGFGEKEEILPGEREKAFKTSSKGSDQNQEVPAVVLSKPYTNKDWSHEGGNPQHRVYHVTLRDNPKVVWSASIGRGANKRRKLVAQPIVKNNVVFTMDATSKVTAFDLKNGRSYWQRDLVPLKERDGYFGGGLAYYKGALFVTTGFAEIHSLAAREGSGRWRKPLPAPSRTAPTVAGGLVYVVTIDNQVLAFDVIDGKEVWKYKGAASQTSLLGGASPAVHGKTVLVGLSSGELIALDAENGRVLWSDSLAPFGGNSEALISTISAVKAAPVIDRNFAFVLSHAGRMAAFDFLRGVQVWESDVGGQQSPAVGPDHLFVVTADGRMAALERTTGLARWVRELSKFENSKRKTRAITWYGPVLAGNKLVLASSHGLMVYVSPYSGRVIGIEKLGAAVVTSPIVVNNTLLVLNENGRLIAYR
jgi:outer membrane protein assembly factor BamB